MSVCLKLKISVTTEPIILYSSGNIPTGPVMVLGCFLGEWDTATPPPKKKKYLSLKLLPQVHPDAPRGVAACT